MDKDKELLTVIVEMTPDGSFDCFIEDDEKDFGAAGFGKTAQEAIADFHVSCREMREEYGRQGKEVPEYGYEFKYDLRSFFDYFDCFNVKKVAARAGINYAQLNQYLTGRRKASRAQYEKIAQAVRKIAADLQQATF